mgnify:CR=1 FL=1
MRHYEVVFLVHPDQSENVPAMMERYRSMIEGADGKVHREEDWGRRQLSHAINKIHKAHYLMMNIECGKAVLDELVGAFRFNDAVIRYLVIKRDKAITEVSLMAQAQEEEKAREEAAAAAEIERVKIAAKHAQTAVETEKESTESSDNDSMEGGDLTVESEDGKSLSSNETTTEEAEAPEPELESEKNSKEDLTPENEDSSSESKIVDDSGSEVNKKEEES